MEVCGKRKDAPASNAIVDTAFFDNRAKSRLFQRASFVAKAVEQSEAPHGLKCPIPIFSEDKSEEEFEIERARRNAPLEFGGQKKFLTAGYELFFAYYSQALSKTGRHFYEMVIDDVPCHLYIDAEIYLTTNTPLARSCDELEELFFKELYGLMHDLNYIESDTDVRVITLDSSNDAKFSKHYLVKMRDKCFKNNYHCGAFMRRLHNRMLERYGQPDSNMFFYWSDKETEFKYDAWKHNKTFIADLCVYTKRRQFRLYGSSKRSAPERILLREGESRAEYLASGTLEREVFFDTLIQYIAVDTEIVTCLEVNGEVEPVSSSHRRFFLENGGAFKRSKHVEDTESQSITNFYEPAQRSQFPSICQKMLPLVQAQLRDNALAQQVTHYFPISRILSVSTSSHMCELVTEGCHRNNHVYYIVDLRRRVLYQKCTSQRCLNKRGTPIPIRDETALREITDFIEHEATNGTTSETACKQLQLISESACFYPDHNPCDIPQDISGGMTKVM